MSRVPNISESRMKFNAIILQQTRSAKYTGQVLATLFKRACQWKHGGTSDRFWQWRVRHDERLSVRANESPKSLQNARVILLGSYHVNVCARSRTVVPPVIQFLVATHAPLSKHDRWCPVLPFARPLKNQKLRIKSLLHFLNQADHPSVIVHAEWLHICTWNQRVWKPRGLKPVKLYLAARRKCHSRMELPPCL